MSKNVIYELAKQAGFDAELMRTNADRGNPSIAETFAELLLAYSARQLHAWGYIDEYGEVQKFENPSAHKRDAYSGFQFLYITTPQGSDK